MGIRLVSFPRGQSNVSSVGAAASNTITITQEHNFNVGDIVYCDTDGTFKKAIAEDTKRIEVIGFVSSIKNSMTFNVLIAGKMVTDKWSSYLSGQVIYLSETTPGDTVDNPIVWRKPVAIKVPDGIIVNIQRSDMIGHGCYYSQSGNDHGTNTSGSSSDTSDSESDSDTSPSESDPDTEEEYYTKAQVDTMINDLKASINKNNSGGSATVVSGGKLSANFTNYYTKKEINSLLDSINKTIATLKIKSNEDAYTDEQVKTAVKNGIIKTASLLNDVYDFVEVINKISNSDTYPDYIGVKDETSVTSLVNSIDNADLNAMTEEDAEFKLQVNNIQDTISMIKNLIEDINNGNVT